MNAIIQKIDHYANPAVVRRIAKEHQMSLEDATVLFEDTKKFLALGAMTRESISPTARIDKGWHEFLMFTKDYAEFCHVHLGTFIHHMPFGDDVVAGTDGALRARELAKIHFGNISENWELANACADCSPDSNCEASPSDCASNVTKMNLADCSPDSNCESAPSDCALNVNKGRYDWPMST